MVSVQWLFETTRKEFAKEYAKNGDRELAKWVLATLVEERSFYMNEELPYYVSFLKREFEKDYGDQGNAQIVNWLFQASRTTAGSLDTNVEDWLQQDENRPVSGFVALSGDDGSEPSAVSMFSGLPFFEKSNAQVKPDTETGGEASETKAVDLFSGMDIFDHDVATETGALADALADSRADAHAGTQADVHVEDEFEYTANYANAGEEYAVAAEAEEKYAENSVRELEDALKVADEEAREAQAELTAQENVYNRKREELTEQAEKGGLMLRNKAKFELLQLKAMDDSTHRRAQVRSSTSLKKAEVARARLEAATGKAETSRKCLVGKREEALTAAQAWKQAQDAEQLESAGDVDIEEPENEAVGLRFAEQKHKREIYKLEQIIKGQRAEFEETAPSSKKP